MTKSILHPLLVLLLPTSPFAAETLEIATPLVVTGSRLSTSSFDQPYSIDSVNGRQISEGQLGINASEALSRVPGLAIQNRQNYAQDLQISSRGFGTRSAFGVRGIKLVADGIPASTPDGQGQAATFNLDTADRIEVLRGPASTLYGSNAGGVIQVFSRDGRGSPRAGVETLFGSDGLTRNRLSAEGEADGIGFVLDASRLDTDGYRDHSAARRDQTFAKLNLAPDHDSTFNLIFSSLEQNDTEDPLGQTWEGYRADPRSVTANALLYDTRKSIDHQQLGSNYERHFGDATLQATAYAGRRSVLQFLSIPKGVPANERGGGVVDFDRTFYGGSLRWLQPVERAPGDLQLVFGLDYDRSRDDRQGYQNFVGDQLGVKGELRRDEIDTVTSLDPYAQATWTLGDWTLQGGLRYSTVEIDIDDRFITASNGDDSGRRRFEQATPTLSLGYAFSPTLNGYISVGKAFETPTQGELAYAPGTNSGSNLDLDPATSTQYELGLKTLLGKRVRINAALFQIDTDDEIVVFANQNGRTSYQNAGRTQRRGFELGLDSQLNEHWSAYLAYTYLSATYASRFNAGNLSIEEGNDLPGVPRTTLYGELNWRPKDGISTALEAQYRSQVYTEDTNTAKAAPSYAVFHWRTRLEQHNGPWTFHQTLRLENLLDRQYVGSVIVGDGNGRYYEAAPGRSWYAGAGVELQF